MTTWRPLHAASQDRFTRFTLPFTRFTLIKVRHFTPDFTRFTPDTSPQVTTSRTASRYFTHTQRHSFTRCFTPNFTRFTLIKETPGHKLHAHFTVRFTLTPLLRRGSQQAPAKPIRIHPQPPTGDTHMPTPTPSQTDDAEHDELPTCVHCGETITGRWIGPIPTTGRLSDPFAAPVYHLTRPECRNAPRP